MLIRNTRECNVCPSTGGGGTPVQFLSWSGLVSGPRSFLGGTPGPGLRVPREDRVASQVGTGHPPPGTGVPPPPSETEQESEYLLRSGRNAPCDHPGGLSCLCIQTNINQGCWQLVLKFSILQYFLIDHHCNTTIRNPHKCQIRPMLLQGVLCIV